MSSTLTSTPVRQVPYVDIAGQHVAIKAELLEVIDTVITRGQFILGEEVERFERDHGVKVMHACDEDLEMLQLVTGVQPSPVFDTQLAAAFSGHGASLSYGGLVKTLLGVTVEKDETRSNWRQRPLSPDQLRYAELDVTYLLPLHQKLS